MSDCPDCNEPVFPDHPEWGDIRCNRPDGHEPPHARFDTASRAGRSPGTDRGGRVNEETAVWIVAKPGGYSDGQYDLPMWGTYWDEAEARLVAENERAVLIRLPVIGDYR